MAPLVSWLLCAHNLSPALHDTIRSCFRQTVYDFELVFVANGPRARFVAREVQESFGTDSRLRVCVTQVCYLTFSLNLGVSTARGAYIARIDADDLSEPYRLERQLRVMELDPTIAVLGTGYRFIDDFGNPGRVVVPPLSDSEIRGALFYKNPICHPSTLLRRDAVLHVGGYGGGMYAEDYHLWVQFALGDRWSMKNISDVCVGYRTTAGDARGARRAYASVAGTQIEGLCRSGDFRWLLGAVRSSSAALWSAR
jgi:glycosyltransferase involved in cell wall biosynthesis